MFKLNLMAVGALVALTVGLHAQAADKVCNDESKIGKAAESAFSRREKPMYNEVNLSYANKHGKDKWIVELTVDEECLTSAVVYTKAGTCKIVSDPVEIGQRDCG